MAIQIDSSTALNPQDFASLRVTHRVKLGSFGFVFIVAGRSFIVVNLAAKMTYSHFVISEIGFVCHNKAYQISKCKYQKCGIRLTADSFLYWIPACAGMTFGRFAPPRFCAGWKPALLSGWKPELPCLLFGFVWVCFLVVAFGWCFY